MARHDDFVVAAGNGFLSESLYRGIAPDANVVLVKIGKTGHIPETNIERGLRWVLQNKDKYAVRIVNISAGGDFEQTYLRNPLCSLVEEVVDAGLTVVCAVGNAGLAPSHLFCHRQVRLRRSPLVDWTIKTHSIEPGAVCIDHRMD